LPFCHVSLKGLRPLSKAYPKEIKTLGDHLRKRRLDLGLLQKQAAKLIGVEVSTLRNWEGQRNTPALPGIPGIIRFLGYNPLPEAETVAQKLTRYRTSQGISQEKLAKQLGIDESTLARWERGDRLPTGLYGKLVEKLLADPSSDH
jgi:transcriptional regulator with XRE-family HTH domain